MASRWKIVRRHRHTGVETVIGFADTDTGAVDVRPRDDATYTYDVVNPDGDRVVTRDTAVPHELVEVERRITGFKVRGRLVSWTARGVTIATRELEDESRWVLILTLDIWRVITLEPKDAS